MQQAFVKNGEVSVEKYLAEEAKKAGGTMKAVEFVRFEKGEGLEKRSDDFANEVASMIKQTGARGVKSAGAFYCKNGARVLWGILRPGRKIRNGEIK